MAPAARSSQPNSTAGIVVWRQNTNEPTADIEILVVHPGGPFWVKKDEHAWSIPKGEFDPDTETPVEAAHREFEEELGRPAPKGDLVELRPFRTGKKKLYAFAVEGTFDEASIQPHDTHRSMVELTWPPRSGQTAWFPEVDRAAWISLATATSKLHKGQGPIVDQLQTRLARP